MKADVTLLDRCPVVSDVWRLANYAALRWPNSMTRIVEDKDDWTQHFQMTLYKTHIDVAIENLTLEEAVQQLEKKANEAIRNRR